MASQALGGVAIGNLNTYLPFILQQIQSQVCDPLECCNAVMVKHDFAGDQMSLRQLHPSVTTHCDVPYRTVPGNTTAATSKLIC